MHRPTHVKTWIVDEHQTSILRSSSSSSSDTHATHIRIWSGENEIFRMHNLTMESHHCEYHRAHAPATFSLSLIYFFLIALLLAASRRFGSSNVWSVGKRNVHCYALKRSPVVRCNMKENVVLETTKAIHCCWENSLAFIQYWNFFEEIVGRSVSGNAEQC